MKVPKHLLELDLRRRFDRLGVGTAVAAQPVAEEPGLADAPPTEQDEEPPRGSCRVELRQFTLAIDELVHATSVLPIRCFINIMFFKHYV